MDERTENLLRELADKLGVTTEKLWGVMVAGQYAMGYKAIILSVLCLGVVVFGVLLGKKAIASNRDEIQFGCGITGILMIFFGASGMAFNLSEALTRLLSPEYSALHKLAEWFQ